jgi:hypothetical protein
MANNGSDDDGAANNGFGRRFLHQWEGRLLYVAGYPAPPDFRAPGGWRLSAGGIPIPPPPQGAALDTAIDEILEGMSDEQRANPRFYPDNYPAWNMFFLLRATTPPTAAAGGARAAAPSRPLSSTSRTTTRRSSGCCRHSDRRCPTAGELLDATADGIRLLRIGVLQIGVDEVGITVVGIHAEDRQAGAAICSAEAQQRRPRHPRGGAHRVAAASSQAEEGRHCQGHV